MNMGKPKKNKPNGSVKQADKAEIRSGTHKRDVKAKRAKPEDHLAHIPFRLREIMKSKDRMKSGSFKAKRRKKPSSSNSKPPGGDIPVPHFKRRRNESERAYVRRMESETQHVLFLTENQVDRKPELDATPGKSSNKKEADKIRLQRLHEKKLNRQEAEMEKEMFIDHVAFGEVTMAPPSLTAKPKKAPVKSQKASKELLLNSLLGQTALSTAKPSMARQRIMEEERQRAVEAYRLLKKQKQQQHEARTASLEKLKNPQ